MNHPESPISAVLHQQLTDIAQTEGFVEFTIQHEAGSEKGDGFVGTMLSVILQGIRQQTDGTRQSDRLSLICKLTPTNVSKDQQYQSELAFDREIQVYSQILPSIERFQIDNGLLATERFNVYPKCYLTKPKTLTDAAIIIMQDLRSSGFSMWGKKQPLQFVHAKLLVQQLGQLHGVSVAMKDQQPKLFAEWTQMADIYGNLMRSPILQSMFAATYDRAIALLDNPQHIRALKAFKTDYMSIFAKSMDGNALGAFSVLVHGDCWNNNMMYGPNNESINLLDWQATRVTSPAVDLATFMFSSTEKSLREQHFDELIRLYYGDFAETIRKCGSNPDKLYTLDDLQAQLKTFGVIGVAVAPIAISVMVSDHKDLLSIKEMENNVQNELDQGAQLANLNLDTEQVYKQRLSDVLDDAMAYGWLADYVE